MNERIRELSKQAWVWAEQQEYTDPTKEFSDILEAKFAELIVRECLEKVHECVQTRDTSRYYPDSDGRKIKEHFGIE